LFTWRSPLTRSFTISLISYKSFNGSGNIPLSAYKMQPVCEFFRTEDIIVSGSLSGMASITAFPGTLPIPL
jgi:hypothetical protein